MSFLKDAAASFGFGESSYEKRARRYNDEARAQAAAAEERAAEQYGFYKENIRPRYEQMMDEAFDPEYEQEQRSLAMGDYARGADIYQQGQARRMASMGVNPSDMSVRSNSDLTRMAAGRSQAGSMAARRVQSQRAGLTTAGMGMGATSINQTNQSAANTGNFAVQDYGQANAVTNRLGDRVENFWSIMGGKMRMGGGMAEGGVVPDPGEDAYWEEQEKQFFADGGPVAPPITPGYHGGGAVRYNRGGPVRRLVTPEESLYNDAAYWASFDDAVQGEEYAKSGNSYAEGGPIDGPGTGTSDSVPASINGVEPARLSDGEFVVPADVVEYLGQKYFYDQIDKARKELAAGGGAEAAKMASQQGGARRQPGGGGAQQGPRRMAA